MITINIPGTPVAKGRARSFIRAGRIGHHTPEKTVNYEGMVALAASQAMGVADANLLAGPLAMSFMAVFPIPKSWSKKRVLANDTRPEFVTKKPDLDNLAKSLADGMNGVVYGDDAQIAQFSMMQKVYGARPGVVVKVWELAS
jgi:Holliday junction resolvase RusA-like endonuclease